MTSHSQKVSSDLQMNTQSYMHTHIPHTQTKFNNNKNDNDDVDTRSTYTTHPELFVPGAPPMHLLAPSGGP